MGGGDYCRFCGSVYPHVPLIEAYVIPTSSMEGSMMVGDFLFVSKPSYGLRMPQTVAMIPLLHDRIPVINKESYLETPRTALPPPPSPGKH